MRIIDNVEEKIFTRTISSVPIPQKKKKKQKQKPQKEEAIKRRKRNNAQKYIRAH